MKHFSFRLERVLDWKTVVAQQEQMKLELLHKTRDDIAASLLNLGANINELSESAHAAETGHELAYSAQARDALLRNKDRKQREHAQCESKIASQQVKLRTAETERRLVTKLKERSQSDWTAEMSREMEATASDLFLGGWKRR